MCEDADRRPLVQGCVAQDLVGPADHELVGLRDALGSDEARPRVGHGYVVAEHPPRLCERRGVGDCPEDVHPRPWQERKVEDVARELRLRPLPAGDDARLARNADLELDWPLLGDCSGQLADDLEVDRADEDPHGAAARKADLEGGLVLDPIFDEACGAAGQHRLGLLHDRGLDAPSRDRARDVAALVHRQGRSGLARRGPLRLDDDRPGRPHALRVPGREAVEDVSHS